MRNLDKLQKASSRGRVYRRALKREQQEHRRRQGYEISGMILVALAFISWVSLLSTSAGIVGHWLNRLLGWLGGKLAFILPLGPLFLGGLFIWAKELTSKQLLRSFCFIMLFLLLGAGLHFSLPDSWQSFAKLATVGEQGMAGGVLGGSLAVLLYLGFGRLGAYVVLLTIGVAIFLLLTEIPLPALLLKTTAIGKGIGGRFASWVHNYFLDVRDELNELLLHFKRRHALPKVVHEETASLQEVAGTTEQSIIEPIDSNTEDVEPKQQQAFTPKEKPVVKPVAKPVAPAPCGQAELALPNLYVLPPLSILPRVKRRVKKTRLNIEEQTKLLEDTLESFGISAKVIQVNQGPVVTRYELQPAPGIKVSRIVSLADDLALSLAAPDIRIEAPIPGKAAIGIEVPNQEITPVFFREVLESEAFSNAEDKLAIALGKDIAGAPVIAKLTSMPHLLIAGATGSGKSVCINTIIASLLFRATPKEVRLIMVDPKRVELACYEGIPHLMAPVVTDPKKASAVLHWVVEEMENRYKLFASAGVRNVERYNTSFPSEEGGLALPYIVVIIDELADLMMVAPAEVEESICRLAQMARAAGIHLVIATQRPSVDVITGLIKANITSRIAFAVSSQVDSRTILDMAGAERLLGRGDMLFHPTSAPKPIRVQGAYITDQEVEELVGFWLAQGEACYIPEIINMEEKTSSMAEEPGDALFEDALRLVIQSGQASASLLQRRLRVGYTRAARLIDMMEARGYVGPHEGSKPRVVLAGPEVLTEGAEELARVDPQS